MIFTSFRRSNLVSTAPVRECLPVLRVYILCQHPFIVFSIRFRRSVFSNIQSCCLLKSTKFRKEVRCGIFGSGSALMSKSSECKRKKKEKMLKKSTTKSSWHHSHFRMKFHRSFNFVIFRRHINESLKSCFFLAVFSFCVSSKLSPFWASSPF